MRRIFCKERIHRAKRPVFRMIVCWIYGINLMKFYNSGQIKKTRIRPDPSVVDTIAKMVIFIRHKRLQKLPE